MRPIFQRNHDSFEDNLKTKNVLIKIITQWFDAGTLEYVCHWHWLSQCILVCRSVPKATEPFFRLVADARPINVCASAWRVKYIMVSDLCLVLMCNSLMSVLDLKAAYHLVRYSGCREDTRYICDESQIMQKQGMWPSGRCKAVAARMIVWVGATSLSWQSV